MSENNPGTSINFDAQALHDADEAEYQREEQERQNELRALLTQALDEDLTDDEEGSDVSRDNLAGGGSSVFTSMQSPGSGRGRDEDAPLHRDSMDRNEQQWPAHEGPAEYTSTPIMDLGPPNSGQYAYGYQDNWNALGDNHQLQTYQMVDGGNAGGNQHLVLEQNHGVRGPEYLPNALHLGADIGGEVLQMDSGGYYGNHGSGQGQEQEAPGQFMGERREVEGGNEEESQAPIGMAVSTDIGGSYPAVNSAESEQHYQYTEDHAYPGMYQADDGAPYRHVDGNYNENVTNKNSQPEYHHVQERAAYVSSSTELDTDGQMVPLSVDNGTCLSQAGQPNYYMQGQYKPPFPADAPVRPAITSPRGGLQEDQHKVQYRGGNDPAAFAPRPTTPGGEQVGEYDELQKDFLHQGGPAAVRQLEQLQILYRARGRKVDELNHALSSLQDESDKEVRITKHKLSLAQDEKDGLMTSLEQSQHLLTESKQRENELHGQVAALNTQIQALSVGKEELIQKIQMAESNIEALNAQLMNLGASESLSRAREQHDAIVAGMKQKHDSEVYALSERLDAGQRHTEDKVDEIERLKKQVAGLRKSGEEAQIDRADTINKLSRSLEESQRQCGDLLEAGTGQETSKLRLQLQEVIAGKSIAEDMNSTLQEEIAELKEQVSMYESASQYGVFSVGLSKALGGDCEDSYAQLGIKKVSPPQFTTPTESPSSSRSTTPRALSSEDTVQGLKQEFERCLHSYKAKRQKVTELQDEVRSLKVNLDDTKRQLERSDKAAAESKEALQKLERQLGDAAHSDNPRAAKLAREAERLATEKVLLSDELKELNHRLEETVANEERASQLNRDLNAQMAQMIREFDEDKREALEKCRDACLKHHEDAKERLRQDLTGELQHKSSQLMQQYEHQISALSNDLNQIQKAMDEVKEMYVTVCRDKDLLEENLQREWEHKMEQHTLELKAQFAREKEQEMKKVTGNLEGDKELTMAAAREKWTKEQDEEYQRKLEAELARSRIDWFKDHQASRDQAVERASRAKELEWQAKWDSELQRAVDDQLGKGKTVWQTEQRVETEREVQERVSKARETWQATELQAALSRARDEAKHDHETQMAAQLAREKEKWQQEENCSVKSQVASQASKLHMEKVSLELHEELDEARSEKMSAEKELTHRQEMWNHERQQLLKQKDSERRTAILNVQDQCEKDYRTFLAEHQETLNKAMMAARDQCNKEVKTVTEKYEKDLEMLRSALESGERQRTAEQEHGAERVWQEKLDSQAREFVEEKEALMVTHRESLARALKEARLVWQQQPQTYEQAPDVNESGDGREWDKKWEAEQTRLISELRQRDQLLQSADGHMEAEITKLQTHLLQQYESQLQQELGQLQAALLEEQELSKEHELHQLRDHLQTEHKDKLEQGLLELKHELQAQYQQQWNSSTKEAEKEKETLLHQIEEFQKEKEAAELKLEGERRQLKELQSKYSKDTKNLAKKVEETRKQLQQSVSEVQRLNSALEEQTNQLQGSQEKNRALSKKSEELEQQLRKAEKLRQEVVESLKRSEQEHAQIESSYKQRQIELNAKLQKADKYIKAVEGKAQKQLAAMQDSLEREHAAVVENMKGRTMELTNKHVGEMQLLRTKHKMEKDEMNKVMQELRSRSRMVNDTPTQTEQEEQDEDMVGEMKERYLQAVSKMREEVLDHINKSTERAAETVKLEVLRERQLTARRLRKYYMRCLSQLLDKDCDSEMKAEKLAIMEQFLDNLPERDSSRATTPSVASTVSSRTSTPGVAGRRGAALPPGVSTRARTSSKATQPEQPYPAQSGNRGTENRRTAASRQETPDRTSSQPNLASGPYGNGQVLNGKGRVRPADQFGATPGANKNAVTFEAYSLENIPREVSHWQPSSEHSSYDNLDTFRSVDGIAPDKVRYGDNGIGHKKSLSFSTPDLAVRSREGRPSAEEDGSMTPTPHTPGYKVHDHHRSKSERANVRDYHEGINMPSQNQMYAAPAESLLAQNYHQRSNGYSSETGSDSSEISTPRGEEGDSTSYRQLEQGRDNITWNRGEDGNSGYQGSSVRTKVKDLTGPVALCKSEETLHSQAQFQTPKAAGYKYTSLRNALSTERLVPRQPKDRSPTKIPGSVELASTWDGSRNVSFPDSLFGEVSHKPRKYNPPAEKLDSESDSGASTPTPSEDKGITTPSFVQTRTKYQPPGKTLSYAGGSAYSPAPAQSRSRLSGGRGSRDNSRETSDSDSARSLDASVTRILGSDSWKEPTSVEYYPQPIQAVPPSEGTQRIGGNVPHRVQRPIPRVAKQAQAMPSRTSARD